MREEVRAAGCGRENDLIAFLYNELDPGETMGFRKHAQECKSCSAELAEFTSIRESVVAWRNEALVGVQSPTIQISPAVRTGANKVSALTAIREFFNLSPLWMKGAVVFASLLFCLFAVLAAARFRDAPAPAVANDSQLKKYSEQELKAAVDLRVQDELQLIKKSSAPAPAPLLSEPDQDSLKKVANRRSEVASLKPLQKARRPLSKDERQQLAADLRLIEDPTDGQLDLLDDRINQ